MMGKKVPHWVLAHGDDGRHILFMTPGSRTNGARPPPTPPTFRFHMPFSTASPVLAAPACAPPFSSRENRQMSDWVILATALASFDHAATAHKVLHNPRLSRPPEMFRGARPNIINLSRSYSYQSRGYYASLLAAARGQRVIPSVETIIDLSARKLYENAIPELEDALNKAISDGPDEAAPARLRVSSSEPAPIRASSVSAGCCLTGFARRPWK
jgi:hypothetical protein